jgi:hypothetical protein
MRTKSRARPFAEPRQVLGGLKALAAVRGTGRVLVDVMSATVSR